MGKRKKTFFSEEDKQMVKRYTKRYPASLLIRKMQIKIPMRYYLTPIRMSIIKMIINKILKR